MLTMLSVQLTELTGTTIGLDKSGYQIDNFFISQQKHMLWILIRSASVLLMSTTTYVFVEK